MEHYGILSIIPPIVAIGLCIATRQLVLSLFLGLFSGALIVTQFHPINALIESMRISIDTLASSWNAGIVIFTLLLGGLAGVLNKSGGAQGLINLMIKRVNNGKKGQLTTTILSCLLFFDDYTSMILTGQTMRPLTDALRISREKLSYIVDSAGAAAAATAPISNWVAFEIGVIGSAIALVGIEQNAYLVFLQSIPYRYYGIFSIAFVFFIAIQTRDFGPMYHAEVRAKTTGKVIRDDGVPMAGISGAEFEPPEGVPLRWYNFGVPIIVFLAVAILGLYYSGGGPEAESFVAALGAADAVLALVTAVAVATGIGMIMILLQKIMSFTELMDAWTAGMKAILFTIVFIVLAWGVAGVCKQIGTANYVVELMVAANFPAGFLPAAVFIISGIIAFATGTSWGTMALVLPIAVPASATLGAPLAATLGGVLAGATFGDQTSPISESVVLSSMASASDHMDHVITQLPYALTSAIIGIVVGYIPAGFGVSPWIIIPVGLVVTWFTIRLLGKKTDEETLGVTLPAVDSSAYES